ncbi:HEAT repeat domain-containing protein [Caldisalinibacter kiritimatiensis]|nr:HEAT repeat domain-containing protein [Caldisalinibacter kiritimatiensis]
MKKEQLTWENIRNLEEHHITYLLYKEGKSIETISAIRRMDKNEVEKQIIKAKIDLNSNIENDLLINVISMNKEERLKYINGMNDSDKEKLIKQIMRRYTKFKNTEDRMILIWLIGELKDIRLLPYLRMELKSNSVNRRRLVCSALGKLKAVEGKKWLEEALDDKNPQVRQYAVKALKDIGDENTIEKIKRLLNNYSEKEYVKRAAENTIEEIKKKLVR